MSLVFELNLAVNYFALIPTKNNMVEIGKIGFAISFLYCLCFSYIFFLTSSSLHVCFVGLGSGVGTEVGSVDS